MWIDARIPVTFGTLPAAAESAALIVEADTLPAGATGVAFRPGPRGALPTCACCAGRGTLGAALATLLVARAKGEVTFFDRVVACVATEAGRGAVERAIGEDPVCAARFRLAD